MVVTTRRRGTVIRDNGLNQVILVHVLAGINKITVGEVIIPRQGPVATRALKGIVRRLGLLTPGPPVLVESFTLYNLLPGFSGSPGGGFPVRVTRDGNR